MLTYQKIQELYAKMGYRFFSSKPYDLNFGVIRTDLTNGLDQSADAFNDIFFVAYLDETGKGRVHEYMGTVDPGKLELLDPSFAQAKKDGTAIIAEGYYPSVYVLGTHGTGQWQHEALRQDGTMSYYRDNNRDVILDLVGKRSDNYATNHHAADKVNLRKTIGRYSAGCAVAQNYADLQKTIALVKKQASVGLGRRVSFAVFSESKLGKKCAEL